MRRTVVLLARRRISQPRDRVGDVLRFADGTRARVYRETLVEHAPDDEPVVLVVTFRLRWVRGWRPAHALFRAESLLNTVLFAGFPGLVSKLWLAHDEANAYRGFYEWNRASLADDYVRALWWALLVVSERQSIHSIVLPGLHRDEVLSDPSVTAGMAPDQSDAWWRLASVERRGG